ncbi:hypothetical protein [Psychromonas sp.]|uniref:hypothetical protein n=1 Tax=Psychromonas sp. TaxID=1884585 RepID=UPI0035615EE9
MKLTNLAIIIYSGVLGSSLAYAAGNAVLNVEGEIQINGKTVINNAGEFIGVSNATELSDNAVQLSAYEQQPGIYTYEGGYNGNTVLTITDNSRKEVITKTNQLQISESVIAGNTITTIWSNSNTEYAFETSSSKAETFENLSFSPENYIIGTLTAEVTRYTIVSSSDDDGDIGDSWISGNQIIYSAKLPSYTTNDKTYFNCLFDGDDEVISAIVCPGVGPVQSAQLGKLVSYEPSGTTRSIANSGVTNQALKIRLNALRKLTAKKSADYKKSDSLSVE